MCLCASSSFELPNAFTYFTIKTRSHWIALIIHGTSIRLDGSLEHKGGILQDRHAKMGLTFQKISALRPGMFFDGQKGALLLP